MKLQAQLELNHMMRDMMTLLRRDYRVNVSLQIDAADRAELRLAGTVDVHQAEIPTPGAKERPALEPRKAPIDARWIGSARRVNDHIVLHFESSSDYQPTLNVDLDWECAPHEVTIGKERVAAWRCATSQRMTQRVGAGHHLPPYMQVEMILAAPAERLHIAADARGGADHRSTLSGMIFSRMPR